MDSARETKLFSRIWRHLAAGLGRLRDNGWPVIQTAVVAAVAYFLATFVLDIEYVQAFYAPIAAVVCLSLSLGQPKRRALPVAIGVAVGLTVAYFPRPLSGRSGGGGVALAINCLFPADPERMVERAARPIFEELVSTLEEVAAALKDGDLGRVARALSQGRGIDKRMSGFGNILTAGQETARFAPLKRRDLGTSNSTPTRRTGTTWPFVACFAPRDGGGAPGRGGRAHGPGSGDDREAARLRPSGAGGGWGLGGGLVPGARNPGARQRRRATARGVRAGRTVRRRSRHADRRDGARDGRGRVEHSRGLPVVRVRLDLP